MREVVTARGHSNVTAEHESTFELTTDEYVTPAGDCILGIDASASPADFDPSFIAACRDSEAEISARLEARGCSDLITGRGAPGLQFSASRSLVGRTSTYIDGRTVMLEADKAAVDIDRDLVAALADGAALTCELRVDS